MKDKDSNKKQKNNISGKVSRKRSRLAVKAFTFTVLGIFLVLFFGGPPFFYHRILSIVMAYVVLPAFSLVGFVLAAIALKRIKSTKEKGRVLAVISIVVGLIIVSIFIIGYVVYFTGAYTPPRGFE